MQEIQRRGFIRKKITDYVTQDSPFIFSSPLYSYPVSSDWLGSYPVYQVLLLGSPFLVFQSSDWLTKDNRCQIRCFLCTRKLF